MDRIKDIENYVAGATDRASSAYVPPFQLTNGQLPPIAANGGLSYMSFDRDEDAGTAAATAAALKQLAEGHGQAIIDMLDQAPPGPIQTKWGIVFRTHAECMEHIRANHIVAPEGGLALPLRYTIFEQPSYSIVSSNSLWRDPARAAEAAGLRKEEQDVGRRGLYFPQILRDGRRIAEYYPGLSPNSPECMDKLGVALAHLESKCKNFYDSEEVERVYYPEIEKLLLEFFPGATDALVYNHDVFNKDYKGDRTEDQEKKNPGVNASYANIVHNDLNDNSGRVRCRELLTKNLRNFGREQHYTPAQADAKMSRRFVSINLAKPMETVGQYPSCSAPGPLSPTNRTSPTIVSTMTASARPPASPIAPTMSGTGSRSRSRPRSRCSSATTRSPTVRCRAGLSTVRAPIPRRPKVRPAGRTWWSDPSSSFRELTVTWKPVSAQ
jgi:hypothetical protein